LARDRVFVFLYFIQVLHIQHMYVCHSVFVSLAHLIELTCTCNSIGKQLWHRVQTVWHSSNS